MNTYSKPYIISIDRTDEMIPFINIKQDGEADLYLTVVEARALVIDLKEAIRKVEV